LKWILRRARGGVQYVEHVEGDGAEMFAAACRLGLEGIVSKRLDAPYRSGPARSWLKTKNPKAPAATLRRTEHFELRVSRNQIFRFTFGHRSPAPRIPSRQ
jgi:ATP-dependent DNA ligase